MTERKRIRVLLGKLGLDCHDTGISTLAYLLREEGFEVIYMGLHNSAEDIYRTAIQEGVDVIGTSFLSGQHLPQMRRLMTLIRREDNIIVLVGGIIPKADIVELETIGVLKVFIPGTTSTEVINFISEQWNVNHTEMSSIKPF